jgi:hypothetical protein
VRSIQALHGREVDRAYGAPERRRRFQSVRTGVICANSSWCDNRIIAGPG